MTDERRLVLFPARSIVKDPRHRESLIRREQDLNLPRTCPDFAKWSCAVVITTTPRWNPEKYFSQKIIQKMSKAIFQICFSRSSRSVFDFKKSFIWDKRKWSGALFQYISIALNFRNKQILHYWSRYLLNLFFLEKGLGLVSPPHFVYDFSRYIFLVLYSTN